MLALLRLAYNLRLGQAQSLALCHLLFDRFSSAHMLICDPEELYLARVAGEKSRLGGMTAVYPFDCSDCFTGVLG